MISQAWHHNSGFLTFLFFLLYILDTMHTYTHHTELVFIVYLVLLILSLIYIKSAPYFFKNLSHTYLMMNFALYLSLK